MKARVVCVGCGRSRMPHKRVADGELCSNCAAKLRPPELCGRCGHIRPVIVRDPSGSAVCNACYLRARTAECTNCGETSAIGSRSPTGVLCKRCKPAAPPTTCGTCGHVGIHTVHDTSGRPMCRRCWAAQQKPCVCCGVVDRVAVRILRGPVCDSRLGVLFAHPVECSDCRTIRPNVAGEHHPLCPECAGLRFKFECPRCHRFVRPTVKPGVCSDCHVDHLRALSVERFATATSTLGGYHRQVAELIEATPDPWGLPMKRYARWAITGPLQRRIDSGLEITTATLRWPLRRLKIAQRFATASAASGLGPSDIRQTSLDRWLAEFPYHRAELRGLVKWCSEHRYMHIGLAVDPATTRDTRRSLTERERLELVERLLSDQHDPPARLAALLVILFGQPLTRTSRMRTAAVDVTSAGVALQLPGSTVRLREPLGKLAADVASNAQHLGSPWLFPSAQGGRPLSPNRLAERLRTVGLRSPRDARNTARAVPAEQMPAALVAEIIGISDGTAEGWAKAVGAARSTYIRLRQ
jgi:hypothetical protein